MKLHSLWDELIILSNWCWAGVLKNYGNRNIFIAGDESVEVCRQQTIDGLKFRAERANKTVVISDGVLSIDGVVEFSLTVCGALDPPIKCHQACSSKRTNTELVREHVAELNDRERNFSSEIKRSRSNKSGNSRFVDGRTDVGVIAKQYLVSRGIIHECSIWFSMSRFHVCRLHQSFSWY